MPVVPRRGVLAVSWLSERIQSTILRVISGLGMPRRGVVRLNGRTVTYTSPQLRARLGIQQLPGGNGVFPDMTVRQNLVMGGYIHRGDREDVERRIVGVLDLFPDLADRQGQRAGSMSGGQQQMLAMGRALMMRPEILLLDEPSLGLSPILVSEIFDIIYRLNSEQGVTMLLVEQNAHMALKVSQAGYVIEVGRIVFDGDRDTLLSNTDIQEFYLGKKKVIGREKRRWKLRKTWR